MARRTKQQWQVLFECPYFHPLILEYCLTIIYPICLTSFLHQS
jgi:hypothetical protein